ncbi:hypothetical protein EGM88_05245 [Aureibaculum marinum]|uniref:Uncharacterized protein n=2 Tax=Aureibaculum marinum TaxID=2487930 RepID=A0A3N4P4D0_9FLAO|nr:hypothetical protein EGM88_05245 [Aureibaculum marinum]
MLFQAIAINPSIVEVRDLYVKASASQEAATKFYQKLKNVTKTDEATLVGYKAAATTMQAKYADKIKNKKALFKEGVVLLEDIIIKYPSNIELRLIRLSIQEHAPKILKYKMNIKEDKMFITSQLSYLKNKALKNHIKGYVSQSNAFTAQEKTVISKL